MKSFLLANKETYRKLSTFESVEDMNVAVRQHKNSNKLTKSQEQVLDVLSQHSCKYTGVSYKTKANIGKLVGLRRETVSRICKQLETLGIIRQYELKRDGGDRRQTSNAIVILPYKEATNEEVTPEKSHHKTRKPNKLNNTLQDTVYNHPRALRQAIPEVIYDALAPFFDADGLYKTYGILLRSKAAINRNITVEEYGEKYVDVFLNVIRKYKQSKVRKSLDGYLYASWERLTTRITQQLNAVSRGVYFDWLNESEGEVIEA